MFDEVKLRLSRTPLSRRRTALTAVFLMAASLLPLSGGEVSPAVAGSRYT